MKQKILTQNMLSWYFVAMLVFSTITLHENTLFPHLRALRLADHTGMDSCERRQHEDMLALPVAAEARKF